MIYQVQSSNDIGTGPVNLKSPPVNLKSSNDIGTGPVNLLGTYVMYQVQESAGTGPVNLKVVPNGCCLGRSPWTN